MKARAGLLSIALVSAGLALAPLTSAGAVSALHTSIANVVPQTSTPDVLQNHVEEITKVGNKIILGGNFVSAQNHGTTNVVTRHHILAFDATTGLIDTGFVPDLTNPTYPEPTSQVQVNALLPGPTANTVYVGGSFKQLNGLAVPRLILLDINTGARVTTFKPAFNGQVNDVKRFGNRLYVAGNFTTAGGQPHVGIATVNATTGALDPSMNVQLAGHHNWTTSSPSGDAKAAIGAFKLDVTPDGSRVVAIGNFKTVSDATHTNGDYDQVVLLDTSGTSAVIANWQTNRYDERCYSGAYDQWVRDVDFSPDGSYFVIVGTGGYPLSYSNLCDAAARWETAATGSLLNPSWVDWTGGDTLLSVAITGAAVYVGGHQRWLNNKLASDRAGPGAVPRAGLGALNPVNGMPLAWNPGRDPRGAGAYAMFASSDGVYVGSDTMYIGTHRYKHERIAAFPLAGGTAVAPDSTGTLPGSVHQTGRPTTLYRVNAGGQALPALDLGPDWASDSSDVPLSLLRNTGSLVSTYGGTPARNAVLPATTPTALFSSERYDPAGGSEMSWTFPVPAGTPLKVRLYFANRYSGTGTIGKRKFNVSIDGEAKLADYDIVADTGNNTGTMKEFPVTSDGTVNVDLTHGTIENPLINGIEIIASPATGADDVTSRTFDGIAAGAPTTDSATGVLWSHTRGAFMVDGRLFYGYDDGNLRKRTFDGTTFGPEVLLDPYNDPEWSDVDTGSGQTYRGLASGLKAAMHNATAMFYSKGRIYYTFSGRTELFSRYFQPDSGIIGSEEFVGDPGGINWSDNAGIFLDAANNTLYYAKRDGSLWSATWSPAPAIPVPGAPVGGKPVSGTQVKVSAPGEDWRGLGVFLYAP
ncbi:MAG: malectin [Actinomycetota bacterium]|nr:malectin [Actinomycetota bacterium]